MSYCSGILPQTGSSICCAETVSSRNLKLCDFYSILIGLNSEYKPVPWGIHCCHGNAVIEGRSVKFLVKSAENLHIFAQIVYNFYLTLFKPGFFGFLRPGGVGVDSTPSRKQCYSWARTMKLGTRVYLPKNYPCAKFGCYSSINDVTMTSSMFHRQRYWRLCICL